MLKGDLLKYFKVKSDACNI